METQQTKIYGMQMLRGVYSYVSIKKKIPHPKNISPQGTRKKNKLSPELVENKD